MNITTKNLSPYGIEATRVELPLGSTIAQNLREDTVLKSVLDLAAEETERTINSPCNDITTPSLSVKHTP